MSSPDLSRSFKTLNPIKYRRLFSSFKTVLSIISFLRFYFRLRYLNKLFRFLFECLSVEKVFFISERFPLRYLFFFSLHEVLSNSFKWSTVSKSTLSWLKNILIIFLGKFFSVFKIFFLWKGLDILGGLIWGESEIWKSFGSGC